MTTAGTGTPVLSILPAGGGDSFLVLDFGIFLWAGGQVRSLFASKVPLTRAVSVSRTLTLLVACDTAKTVHLFRIKSDVDAEAGLELVEVATGRLEKSAMCAAFDAQDCVLVGDKFGDVVRFPLDFEEAWSGKIIAGCVSMVTDMAVTPDGASIVWADRDEKIRLVNSQYPFLIERFLLAHTEYVAAVRFVPASGTLLVSVGGDQKLILWDVGEAEPLQTVKIDANIAEDDFNPVSLAVNHSGTEIALLIDDYPHVLLFDLANSRISPRPRIVELQLPGLQPVAAYYEQSENRLLISGRDRQHSRPLLLSLDSASHTAATVPVSLPDAPVGWEALAWEHVARKNLRKRKFEPRPAVVHRGSGGNAKPIAATTDMTPSRGGSAKDSK